MRPILSALMAFVTTLFRSYLAMQLEIVALRCQVAVYQQSVPRPRLPPADRLFWVWLSRLWPGRQAALTFVQPRIVIAWQQKRFREHWRRLSQQGKPGGPAIVKEVRELIQDMRRSNPTWPCDRVAAELDNLRSL